MTLEEAIAHAREKACGTDACADDHRDLADFLDELRDRRAGVPWVVCEGCGAGCREDQTGERRWRSVTSCGADHPMLCPACHDDGTGREVGL